MLYRRNADDFLQGLRREISQDPSRGLHFYTSRRRAGRPLLRIDYEALGGFELSGGVIPYAIDLELSFPYEIAREIWDQRPSLQAWYRLNKIQRNAWEEARVSFLADLGIAWNSEVDSIYSIPEEIRRGPLRELRKTFRVELSDDELAYLWVRDIKSRLINKRERLFKGTYTQYEQLIDGIIPGQVIEDPELIRLTYDRAELEMNYYGIVTEHVPRTLQNGSLFILNYGRNCCYDTNDYYGGSIHLQFFGRNAGNKSLHIDFSLIEYGRHYASLIPDHVFGRRAPDWVAEADKIDYNSYGIICGSHPSSYTPSAEECRNRDIPRTVALRDIVNGEHLFDLLREKYEQHIPRYKKIFEEKEENQQLLSTKYYHPRYTHIWQIARLVRERGSLLEALGIPNKGGKIPGDLSGEYYFQQYKFILYPSRGKPGKRSGDKGRLMRLYVECPFTGREIPTGRWHQYYPTLLK